MLRQDAVVVSFPPFRLDVVEERLWRGPKQLAIRRKPFAILAHLVASPRRLVTYDELMKRVWGDVTVSESAIRTHLHELRQILGEGLIETVIGRGYRFTGTPERATAAAATPAPVEPVRAIVGRADELATLQAALAKAETGTRQLCFVIGDPGIGKTTLVDTFVESLGNVAVATGQCIEQHGTAEAYMPVIQVFSQLRKAEDTAAETLATLLRHAPTFLAQMPHLVPDGQLDEVQRLARGGNETRVVRELFESIEAMAAQRTLVIVLEDIQWADLATLDLIGALGQRRERARLLLIATSRVAEASTPSHPTNRTLRPLVARNGAIQIDVERIAATDVTALLARRFPANTFPPGLAIALDQMTAGIPLFVAAVVDDLVARAMVVERDGTWQLATSLAEIAAHRADSVRQLIDIQLDRLTTEEQRVLEAGSLFGIIVSTALIAAALEISVEAADDLCDSLAQRSLFLRRESPADWPDGLDTRYAFTHGLVEEVCARRVLPARQVRSHRRIAERLEAAWGARADEVAVTLATHFRSAQLPARAVHYLIIAAERAQRRYATADALVLRRSALELVPRITDDTRDAYELRILAGMTPAVLRIHDEFVRDPAATFGRRLELARKLGDPAPIAAALMDFAFYHTLNANHFAAAAYLEQLDVLLAGTTLPADLVAHIESARAVDYMWRGRLREARALFERLAQEGEAAIIAVGDRRILMRTYLSIACFASGAPDRALAEIQRCVALATEVGDPYTLGLALATNAAVHFMRRDPLELVDATAARVLAIPETAPWHAPATLLRTWVRSQTTPLDAAEADAMIVDFRRRLAKFPLGASTLTSRVIGALARSPRIAEARVLLEEMFEFPRSRGEELFAAELLTMRADLTDDPALAAPVYREATARARANGGKSFELRAALLLAQRCGDTGELAAALAGFEDGAATRDQIEARALLAPRDS